MSKQKKIFRFVKFLCKGGEVSTTPPIGPMLGQFPMDVKGFVMRLIMILKILIKVFYWRWLLTLYKDSTFEYEIKKFTFIFLLELSSKVLQINHNFRNHRGISFIWYIFNNINKNKDYNMVNIKYLLKNIIRMAKNRYKIVENLDNEFYYMYV